MLLSIEQRLAAELSVKFSQIQATIQFLDDGSTAPLIDHSRKVAASELDNAITHAHILFFFHNVVIFQNHNTCPNTFGSFTSSLSSSFHGDLSRN